MNDPSNRPSHPSAEPPLDADLHELSAHLHALARAEAESAGPWLEESVFAASRAGIAPLAADISPVAARVDAAAMDDLRAAPPQLEASAFELSREAVASGRFVAPVELPLHLVHGSHADARPRTRARLRFTLVRVAAALALLAGAAAITLQFRAPSTQQLAQAPTPEPTTAELASRIAAEMDALFETMAIDTAADDVSLESARDAEFDASWVDELFSQEAL